MRADFLRQTGCCFAGGTCLAMQLGEYRESVDMDFLCASVPGYRAIRSTVTDRSLGDLFDAAPRLLRDVRADRYGIRTLLAVDETPIRFEIVLEGRIALACERVEGLPVPVLDRVGLFAEKLLANCDRQADRGTFARDIIDLLTMRAHWGEIPAAAMDAAQAAYGPAVQTDFERAARTLHDDGKFLGRCFEALAVSPDTQARINAQLSEICR